jgi:WD40 repeat protein
VKLWAYPGGDPIKSIEDFKKEVTSVRFVDDKLLIASGEARVRLMKQDGGNVKDYSGSKGYIFSTAVTPDGQTILGGGQDSVLRIWNVPTGKNLFTLDPPEPELPQKSSSKGAKK